jgi:hypothetical protein
MSAIKVMIAVGVGYEFAIVNRDEVKNINLKNTYQIVSVDGLTYPVYKGTTYEDSRLVDDVLDSGKYECYKISDCIVK